MSYYQDKAWNPKKHKEQRRKRPKVSLAKSTKYIEIKTKSRSGVEYSHYELMIPVPERGYNRQAYRVQLAKDRRNA